MAFWNRPGRATAAFFGKTKGGGGSPYIDPLKQQRMDELARQRAEEEELNKQKFSNDELLKGLRNRMEGDKSRIKSLDFPVYKGEKQPSISASSQKAQRLREEMRGKPFPYARKSEKLLKGESHGMSEEQMQKLLDMISPKGEAKNQVLDRLQKQFGKNYGYEAERAAPLEGKIEKDLGRSRENAQGNLKRLNKELSLQEDINKQDIAKGFQKAGLLKHQRKSGLVNQLEEFGNQEHALKNLKNKAQRDTFEEERDFPARKIDIAARSLNRLTPEKAHPDYLKLRNQEIQRIINAYNTPHTSYQGQKVIDVQPETQQSFDFANSLNPKYKDVYHGQRKQLEKGLMNEGLGDKTYKKVPEAINPLLKNLDYLTKQQLKKSSKAIAGKHVRLGTYGSGAHKAETERDLRELMRTSQQEREGALSGVTKSEGDLASRKDQVALSKHKLMGLQGAQEFMHLLDKNKELNKAGWTKRANKQDEENQRLRDWYSQLSHSMAPGDTGEYNRLAKQYDTDLTSLFNVPQIYSENKNSLGVFKNKMGIPNAPYSNYLKQVDELEEAQKKLQANQMGNNSFLSNINARRQALAAAKAGPIGRSQVETINPGGNDFRRLFPSAVRA